MCDDQDEKGGSAEMGRAEVSESILTFKLPIGGKKNEPDSKIDYVTFIFTK